MATMRQRTMSKVSTWNEKSQDRVMVPSGVHVVPGGGIHFPGSHKANKRADALTEENMANVNGNGTLRGEGGKPKVRIAIDDMKKDG